VTTKHRPKGQTSAPIDNMVPLLVGKQTHPERELRVLAVELLQPPQLEASRPPYFAFQLWNVASLTPTQRRGDVGPTVNRFY